MHRHITALVLVSLLIATGLAASAAQAASFPFNGSFELVAGGKPLGWNVEGSWFVRPDAASDGRNGISVFGDYGKQGALLATSGYLLVHDETLTLSLIYSSPTGNVSCGLEFCDRLGRPLATGAWESLPASETRRWYEREIVLPKTLIIPEPVPEPAAPVETPAPTDAAPAAGDQPAPTADQPAPAPAGEQPPTAPAPPTADQPTPAAEAPATAPAAPATPAGETQPAAAPAAEAAPMIEIPLQAPTTREVTYDSVRLVIRIESDGAQIKLDNIKLRHGGPLAPLPPAPKIKAELRPNLLPSGGFALGGECDPRGWAALSDARHAAVLATAVPEANFLSLHGAPEHGAAWLADAVLVDGALPYSLQANVSAADLAAGRLRLLLLLLDPQDDKAVWLQQEQEVAAGENGVMTLALPRLWTTSGAVSARVAFEVEPGAEGAALVRSAALCPEPLSLSVRAAAVAGGFRRPTDVSLFVSAVNNTYAALKPKAVMQVQDADGKTVASETRPILIGSRSAAYFPYKPKLTGNGAYRLTVRIVNGGMELGSTRYEFSVGEVASTGP